MEQQDVLKHFNDVASRYDELYGFVYDYLPAFAIKHLQLKPDDLLADIGAGTGAITHLIWKEAGLSNPILCVDPNAEMLQVAESRGGLKPCLATADGFFTNTDSNLQKYSKVLINESAHLFPDAEGTFREALNYLPSNGLVVLIVRATTSTFPMWATLKEKFAPISEDKFKEFLIKAGFRDVRMNTEVGVVKMTKGEWYHRLRRRVFSTLYDFTDEQIEEGLKELDRDWFPGKKDSDLVDISDTLQFFVAVKQ